MRAPKRPLLPVALGFLLGAAWGTGPWAAPAHALPVLALAALPRARWLALAAAVMLARCTLPASPTLPEAGGVWCADGGRPVGGDEAWRLDPGSVRDGEWLTPLGAGRPLLEARGPDAPLRVVRRSLAVDEVRRRRVDDPGWPGLPWARWRAAALARLEHGAERRTVGLARALLLGERSGLEPELADRFTRTGTRHLLALSGLHVGLVAWLVAGPLAAALCLLLRGASRGRMRLPPALPRAALVLALVPLAGGGPPVTRAAVALALAALASEVRGPRDPGGRRVDGRSLWALALILELASAPESVGRVGVQLSYAATLGLLLAAAPATRGLRAALPGGGRVAPVSRSGRRRPQLARVLASRTLDAALSGVAASWVATVATGPLVWHHFGELAPVGILVTPLAVLPLVVLLALGWVAILAPPLAPWVGLEAAADALIALVTWADALPGTPVVLPPRPLALLAVVAVGLLALAAGRGGRAASRATRAGLGALLLPWTLGPTGLEVVLLDVGHGTAVLARAPGAGAWLFDAGSRDRIGVARAAVAPVLRAWDVGRLSVVVSHGHQDHDGALPWITARWRPALEAGALDGALDLEAGRLQLPTRCRLGVTLVRGRPGDGNEGSRCLELEWHGRRLLLTGDAEQEGLAATLEAGLLQGPCDLLLLPHHGSSTPHLAALLEATDPREVWISAGVVPDVAAELERRGLAWGCTARHGAARRMYGFGMEVPAAKAYRSPPGGHD